jgi:hypothetical protein
MTIRSVSLWREFSLPPHFREGPSVAFTEGDSASPPRPRRSDNAAGPVFSINAKSKVNAHDASRRDDNISGSVIIMH